MSQTRFIIGHSQDEKEWYICEFDSPSRKLTLTEDIGKAVLFTAEDVVYHMTGVTELFEDELVLYAVNEDEEGGVQATSYIELLDHVDSSNIDVGFDLPDIDTTDIQSAVWSLIETQLGCDFHLGNVLELLMGLPETDDDDDREWMVDSIVRHLSHYVAARKQPAQDK